MVFGKLARVTNSISPLYLNGEAIEYVSSVKYLGFFIKSVVQFRFSIAEDLCKFEVKR